MRSIEIVAVLFLVCPSCTGERARSEAPPSHSQTPTVAAVASAAPSVSAPPSEVPSQPPSSDERRFDAAAQGAIDRGDVPGVVIVVIRNREIVLRKAYGMRSIEPQPTPMTADAIFDLASLTKPLATASSILLLADRKVLSVRDPVHKWIGAFRAEGKERVTIEHLLTHTSGLPAGNARADHASSKDRALAYVLETPLEKAPGEAYLYSDLGYVILGQIVEKASGKPLDEFSKTNIFDPLGMRDTSFRVVPERLARVVPTTLLGEVHDPLARKLLGVGGHAGLFSTADDIARYLLAVMNHDAIDGKPVLSASLTRQMLEVRPVGSGPEKRSMALGSLFDAVGHTGFTGTAFWLDDARGNAVVLLSSALHPNGKGSAKQLRRDVAAAMNSMGKP